MNYDTRLERINEQIDIIKSIEKDINNLSSELLKIGNHSLHTRLLQYGSELCNARATIEKIVDDKEDRLLNS